MKKKKLMTASVFFLLNLTQQQHAGNALFNTIWIEKLPKHSHYTEPRKGHFFSNIYQKRSGKKRIGKEIKTI